MFEIRKWIFPPVLKEVICRVETLEEVKSELINIRDYNNLTNQEVFNVLEVEDMGTGKINLEALL